jgi:hypothetical protein
MSTSRRAPGSPAKPACTAPLLRTLKKDADLGVPTHETHDLANPSAQDGTNFVPTADEQAGLAEKVAFHDRTSLA